MGRATRLHDLRVLFCAAGLAASVVLCSVQAAGELHLHDAGMSDEFCTACSLAHADFAAGREDSVVATPSWTRAAPFRPSSADLGPRPFEAKRSRAPPRRS